MCEGSTTEWIKKAVMPVFSGTASGAAKAAPGVGVSALVVAGIPLESWVTILTFVYILIMIIGALPKIVETIRYFWGMANPKQPETIVRQVADSSVADKIRKAKGGDDA